MPVEPSTDITQSEGYRSRYFESVVKAYAECLQRPALCSIQYDPMLPPNPKLGPIDIEFKIDVEKATHVALDAVNLFPVWEAMLNGEAVPMGKRARVAAACFRLYIERGLLPHTYFKKKHLRMWRPERKTAA